MHLKSVPVDEDRNIVSLIEKIGRAVKFEYMSEEGEIISSEGIIDSVTEYGITINLFNSLHRGSLYNLTFDDGIGKYFPFKGKEAIVRIRDKVSRNGKFGDFEDTFVNNIENIKLNIHGVLEA